jgi:cyclopropane-fatty-acyl-phospholipid synthase
MVDATSTLPADPSAARAPRLLRLWRDPWSEALLRIARRVAHGRLAVTLPDGRRLMFGEESAALVADITIHDSAAIRRLVLGGSDGFAEAYVDGLWDSADLVALVTIAQRNEQSLGDALWGLAPVRLMHRLAHLGRDNSERCSRRNVAFHYDLGNAFYRLWLDESMTYSAGLYHDAGMTLEAAQHAKMRRIAALMQLAPGMSVLEIGCGWGGMAAHLAREHGARLTGLTLSQEQLAWAKAQLGEAADLRLQDYRHVSGQFDRIVSIEMVEAVGEHHWPRYFATLRDRLVPGGIAVLQAITIADTRFGAYRRGADFIQRHVFPGGMLPSPSAIRRQAALAGLALDHVEMFGESYGRTLTEWRRRFVASWPSVAQLGFDQRFRRLWEFYLAYCEAGFSVGTIDVGLWRLKRS